MNKLVLHPSASASVAAKLAVSAFAEVSNSRLILKFKIDSPAGAPKVVWPNNSIALAKLGSEERRDELWKTTCLEAFLLFNEGNYIELNFSPQGQWNAYAFTSYREGMRPETGLSEVTNFRSVRSSSGPANATYELSAELSLSQAVKSPQNFRLGLTCVIETDDGERSYWSLKHSGEKPDFHDSRGYVLEMRI